MRLVVQSLLQSAGELVRAGGRFRTASYAFEFLNYVFGSQSRYKLCDTLEIAVASADELHRFDDIVVVEFHLN